MSSNKDTEQLRRKAIEIIDQERSRYKVSVAISEWVEKELSSARTEAKREALEGAVLNLPETSDLEGIAGEAARTTVSAIKNKLENRLKELENQ